MTPVSRARNNTRRLTVLLLAVVVPPAVALVWLGLRLLDQDRALLGQRETERREATVEAVIRSASDTVAELDRAAAGGPILQGTIRIMRREGRISIEPADGLAWITRPPAFPEFASAVFSSAEEDESHRRVELARARYRALAASGDRTVRAGALVRLARLERRQGRPESAIAAYTRLRDIDDVAVIGTPADLVARRMICDVLSSIHDSEALQVEAQSLARDLTAGRWQLDRASWELAIGDLTRWHAPYRIADERIAISTALELFESDARFAPASEGRRVLRAGGLALTLAWRSHEEGSTLVIAAPPAVRSWLDALRRRHGVDLIAAFDDQGGDVVASVEAPQAPDDGSSTPGDVVRTAAMTGLPWSIRVRVPHSRSVAADFAVRRRLLGGGLVALIVLLAGGSYLLGRVVRRELAVARLQTDFVAAVSHEFRTPLTSLRHITELLQESDDMPPERRRSFYGVLADSSNRLHRLVESLLDFSRMEAGRRPWNRRIVEVAPLVEDVVADFRRAHPERIVQVLSSSASGTISADREAMAHAVWNLLDNAAKYSPREEPVSVHVLPGDGAVLIRVIDRGVGVPASERHEIFDKFVRGARATQLGIKGTGLGLALVSHIVSAHDGRIEVASEEDHGSTFTIVLPLAGSAEDDVQVPSLYASNSHR